MNEKTNLNDEISEEQTLDNENNQEELGQAEPLQKQPEDPEQEQEPTIETEKEEYIAKKLKAKMEKLEDFKPSGDIVSDFNNLLEITGRDNMYKKLDRNEDPMVVLAGLNALKDAWQGTKEAVGNIDTENEAKKLFFFDIPEKEIETANRVINFYLNKYSKNKEDSMKKLFERFKQEEFSNDEEEGESSGETEETPLEDFDVSLDDIEKSLEEREENEELSKEEKKGREREEQTKKLQNMTISGDIAEDYNKIVDLINDDENFKFKKVDSKKNSDNNVLKNLEEVQNTLENASRPAEQKEAIKKFIDYYKIKQSL